MEELTYLARLKGLQVTVSASLLISRVPILFPRIKIIEDKRCGQRGKREGWRERDWAWHCTHVDPPLHHQVLVETDHWILLSRLE